MRRLRLVPMLGMGVAMTLLMSVPAWADDIECPTIPIPVFEDGDFFFLCTAEQADALDENNVFEETEDNDLIIGGRERDRILAQEFDRDRDYVEARQGNDFINVRDGDGRDRVDCGKGNHDEYKADKGDLILNNCEDKVRSGN